MTIMLIKTIAYNQHIEEGLNALIIFTTYAMIVDFQITKFLYNNR